MMEAAPSKAVSSMMRRRKTMLRSLDPIAEDEMEHQLAYYEPDRHHHHHQQTAAWTTTKRPPQEQEQERAGVFMSKYLSVQQGGNWEQSSWQGHHRRAVVYA
ncbi:hypothetical protein QOZ80_2AG0102500 [Eleusine coracana subsp. coracana]|nr:hypothetical protein QOZ80_2AG0102500 [Eleusine coracana subsp. coracana]